MSQGTQPQYESIFRLFREGHKLESILSGWHLNEGMLADILIAGHRSGEIIDPDWLLPPTQADRIRDTILQRTDLTPVQVSSEFGGKVSPHMVRVLRLVLGPNRGIDSVILTEATYHDRLHDDIQGAEKEILIAAPEIKGQHWRRWLDPLSRVIRNGGNVAFFSGKISDLIQEDIKDAGIIAIEQRTHANLLVVDGGILWEGSMNFLLPPAGEEHVRRTCSRIQCDEVRDMHDLYV